MLKLLINGEEYPVQVPIVLTEMAGNNTSSDIKCLVEDGKAVPQSGDMVEIVEDGQTIFLGVCGIPTSPKFDSVHTQKVYSLKCGNGNSLLKRRVVNYGTQKKTVSQIIRYLFDTYIQGENISLGTISNIPILLDAYTAADINLQDVLNELADLVTAAWEVTNERVFNFVVKTDFAAFPHVVTAANFVGGEIQTQTKDHDVRTYQVVKGVHVSTDEQNEYFGFSGEKDEFETMFPIIYKPRIFLVTANVWLPDEKVGVRGIDDNNPNVAFLFSFNSRILKYVTSSNILYPATEIMVRYTGQFPLRVHAYNAERMMEIAQHTGTSGMIEHVHEDKTLTTVADAQRIADALVSQYATPRGEVTWFTTANRIKAAGYSMDDFALLKKFTFDMPEVGLAGEYVITERTQESLTADGKWLDGLKITVKMVDRSYVKSYGQTLRELTKQQQNNIREDVIVVSQTQNTETFNHGEIVVVDYGYMAFFPTAAAAVYDDPFSGLDIYPC